MESRQAAKGEGFFRVSERFCGDGMPPFSETSTEFLVKGYNAADRIIYGTGAIVPRAEVQQYAAGLLMDDAVAYVHVRSARNNCYLFRIDRAAGR